MDAVGPPSALVWAREVAASDASPAALEAHLLRRHPQVLAMLGWERVADPTPAGRRPPRRGRPSARGPLAWTRSIAVLAAFLAPLGGAAALTLGGPVLIGRVVRADSDPIDAALLFPLVAVCFVLGLVQAIGSIRAWRRRGRMRRPHDLVGPVLLLALSTYALVGVVARRDEADATLAIAATGASAAAALLLTVLLATSRRSLGSSDWRRSTRTARIEPATAAIAALPAAERDTIERERDEALRILAHRGCVDAETAERAASVPLGSLSTV